ncbi:MAG: retron St85 family effector protein [Dehalococcoidales bacterium]|nr:retron St85 family effector protein [Dehalococcoidales bacterium]
MMLLNNVAKVIAEGFTNDLEVSAVTVFLAGGSTERRTSIRPQLRKELRGRRYVRGYDVLYPEELFDELMGRQPDRDLLSLENMLAGSAHAIIIIVESPGAIAELGAFANSEQLRPKLIAIVDKRYRGRRTFIMLGPVAQLRNFRQGAVIMHDFGKPDISKLAEDVRRSVRGIIKDTKVDASLSNPIRAQYFLLASLFVAEPIELSYLIKLLTATDECDLALANVVATTALNILLRQGEVALEETSYHLTPKGRQRLTDIIRDSKDSRKFIQLFDKCRVDILNAARSGSQIWYKDMLVKGVSS